MTLALSTSLINMEPSAALQSLLNLLNFIDFPVIYFCLHLSEPRQQNSSNNTTLRLALQYHYNLKLNQKVDDIRTRGKTCGKKRIKDFNRTSSNLSSRNVGHSLLQCTAGI